MKISTGKSSSIGAAALALASSVAFAAGIGGVTTSGARGPVTAPLKGVIRLNAAPRRAVPGVVAPRRVSVGGLGQQYVRFRDSAGGYESALKNMPWVEQHCAAGSYSVQDQMAAGCNGNEPLNQCMDKLYKHCVETWGQAPDQHPGVSSKKFQQSAADAAAQARVLSEMLLRYAADADRNVKTFVP
jgi:hypothetical protein